MRSVQNHVCNTQRPGMSWLSLDFSLFKVFLFNFLHGTKIIMKWATESTNSWRQFTTPPGVCQSSFIWKAEAFEGTRGELFMALQKPGANFIATKLPNWSPQIMGNRMRESGWIWGDYLWRRWSFSYLSNEKRAPGCLGVYRGLHYHDGITINHEIRIPINLPGFNGK